MEMTEREVMEYVDESQTQQRSRTIYLLAKVRAEVSQIAGYAWVV